MIFLPEAMCGFTNINKPRSDKPLYYFKDVTLEKDGFEFQFPTEMELNDTFPACTTTYCPHNRASTMNDIFLVFIEMNREMATIILRENLSYVENSNEIQNLLSKPHFITEEEFGDQNKFKFYRFAKILQNEKIKLRFNERVQKVLLNGDQIIFGLKTKIIIFNMLSSSVISLNEKMIDMAISRYLYVLTEKNILI